VLSSRTSLLLAALCGALLALPGSASAAPGGVTYLDGADRCIAASGGAYVYDGLCHASVFSSATDVALSPSGLHAYAASGDKLVILDRDPATGALTQKAGPEGCWDTISVADEPNGITCFSHDHDARRNNFRPQQVEVHGDLVFAASGYYVDVFRRADDGALTPVACGQQPHASMGCGEVLPSWNAAREMTAAPDGERLYVASGATVVGYAVDAATGTIAEPSSGACITADTATTRCAAFRGLDAGNGVGEVALSPDGASLYAGGVAGLAAFTVDAASGLTQLEGAAGCIGPSQTEPDGCTVRQNAQQLFDMEITPDGKDLLGVNRESSTGGLLRYTRGADGSLTAAGCFSQVGNSNGCTDLATYSYKPYELAIAPQGDSVYTLGSSTSLQGFGRDEATGALTPIAGAEGCVFYQGGNGCQASGPFVSSNAIFLDPLGDNLYSGGDTAIVAMSRELRPGPPADQEGPQVFIDRPLPGQRFKQDEDVRAAFRCTDDTAVASCTGSVADGARLDTATLGDKSITVTATDLAGHTTTTKVGYFVDARPALLSPPLEPIARPAAPAPVKSAAPKPAPAPAPKPRPSPAVVQAAQQATKQAPATFSGSRLGLGSLLNLGSVPAQTKAQIVFAGVVAPGGANVVAAGGANVVAAGGANVVAPGGANVVAPGGANRAVIASAAAARRPIVTLAKGSRFFAKAGPGKVEVKLTKAGRKLLKRSFRRRGRQTVKLTLAVTLATRGSAAPGVMATKTVRIRE